MTFFFQSIFLFITLGIGIGFFFLWNAIKKQNEKKDNDQGILLLQNQLNEITRTLDTKLTESTRAIQNQFGDSAKIARDTIERLTKLDETNRQVISFTDNLKNLERVLTNSKNRGNLGEAGLELILSNILPPGSYKQQYSFKNGDTVDAALFIKDKILPIDAKFSLDNYRRILEEPLQEKKEILEKEFKNDLKKRIDETAKYIRPEEGTLDFAFMFIPAEGIYYDLLVNEVGAVKVNTRSLIEYAFKEKKIIIVSPTTFAAYLQTVLQGLRALQIEESAKEIRKNVEALQKHLSAYEEYMRKLGGHLGTSVSMYNNAYKEFGKIDKDVFRITETTIGVDPLIIEPPQNDV